MEVSQRIAVSGMLASQRQLDVVSNNLANASTPGYQVQDVNFQSTLQNAIQNGQPAGQVTFQPFTQAAANGPDGNGVNSQQQQLDQQQQRAVVRDRRCADL